MYIFSTSENPLVTYVCSSVEKDNINRILAISIRWGNNWSIQDWLRRKMNGSHSSFSIFLRPSYSSDIIKIENCSVVDYRVNSIDMINYQVPTIMIRFSFEHEIPNKELVNYIIKLNFNPFLNSYIRGNND